MAIWHLDTVTAPLLPLSDTTMTTLYGPFCHHCSIHQCYLDYNEGILLCVSRKRPKCLLFYDSDMLLMLES